MKHPPPFSQLWEGKPSITQLARPFMPSRPKLNSGPCETWSQPHASGERYAPQHNDYVSACSSATRHATTQPLSCEHTTCSMQKWRCGPLARPHPMRLSVDRNALLPLWGHNPIMALAQRLAAFPAAEAVCSAMLCMLPACRDTTRMGVNDSLLDMQDDGQRFYAYDVADLTGI